MNWDIHAITVSPWYLDKKKWALKTIRVSRNHKGKLIWIIGTTLTVHADKRILMKDAFFISRSKHVPFIEGVNDGQRVTRSEIQKIKDSHVPIDWKIL